MIAAETITAAVDLLRNSAQPHKIIVFGSCARGTAADDSDLDLLVVERGTPDVVAEMVRLRRVLSPLRIPVDVLVVGHDDFIKWSHVPGNVLHDVAAEGKVMYETA